MATLRVLFLVALLVSAALGQHVDSAEDSSTLDLAGGGNRWVLTFKEPKKKPIQVVWDHAQARQFVGYYREAQQKGPPLEMGSSTIIHSVTDPRSRVTVAVGRHEEGVTVTLFATHGDSSPHIVLWVAQYNGLKAQMERVVSRLVVPPGAGQPFRVQGSRGRTSLELSRGRNPWVLTFRTDDEKEVVNVVWSGAQVREFVALYREAQKQVALLKKPVSTGAGQITDARSSVSLAINRTRTGLEVTLYAVPTGAKTGVVFTVTQDDQVRGQFEKLLERMR